MIAERIDTSSVVLFLFKVVLYPHCMLVVGNFAPSWSALDQDGQEISSVDFSGKRYLLYFYPKDDTPGCTVEACGFRDLSDELSARITILGVSPDSVESHRKFSSKYSLPFSLLSDSNRSMITAYGADGLSFPKRTSFLVNEDGCIGKIYQGFDCALHAEDVARDVR